MIPDKSELKDLLNFAVRLARDAGDMTCRHFKRSFEVPASHISGVARQTHREIQEILEFGLVRDHLIPFVLRRKSSSPTSSRVRPRSTKSTSKWSSRSEDSLTSAARSSFLAAMIVSAHSSPTFLRI